MRFLKLAVRNVGLYSGSHEFDFTPGIPANVVAVGGHNGAGKTTLFRAAQLALYGTLALGDRVSQRAYSESLSDLIHRRKGGDGSRGEDVAEASLDVEYVRSGRTHTFTVTRTWLRSGSSARETLTVRQDDEEVTVGDLQGWVNDLIPPSVLPICFFDAEELAAVTTAEQQAQLLGDTLRRVLGLHLVERLQSDLKQYTFKWAGGRDIDTLKSTLLQEQSLLQQKEEVLEAFIKDGETLRKVQQSFEQKLRVQERRLQAEGGFYAEQRPRLQEELKKIDETIHKVEEQLREASGELLPFALVPDVLTDLKHRLDREDEAQKQQLARDLWGARATRLQDEVRHPRFWDGLGTLPESLPQQVAERLEALLASGSEDEERELVVHDISSSERRQLRDWTTQVTNGTSQQVVALGDQLRESGKKRQQLIDELKRAPEDDTLVPIHEKISELRQEVERLQQEQKKISERLGQARSEQEEQLRKYERSRKEFERAQSGDRGTELATRSQRALSSYADALLKKRLERLESALTSMFNAVCRKDYLLASVTIDPVTYRADLRSVEGRTMSLDDFSAGERQLYVLSLLRAIREISGLELPLFVDTPFARLDEMHRQRLLDVYLPDASSQVVLFTTDAELKVLTTPKRYKKLTRIFHLEHDGTLGATSVEREEITHNAQALEAAYGH